MQGRKIRIERRGSDLIPATWAVSRKAGMGVLPSMLGLSPSGRVRPAKRLVGHAVEDVLGCARM